MNDIGTYYYIDNADKLVQHADPHRLESQLVETLCGDNVDPISFEDVDQFPFYYNPATRICYKPDSLLTWWNNKEVLTDPTNRKIMQFEPNHVPDQQAIKHNHVPNQQAIEPNHVPDQQAIEPMYEEDTEIIISDSDEEDTEHGWNFNQPFSTFGRAVGRDTDTINLDGIVRFLGVQRHGIFGINFDHYAMHEDIDGRGGIFILFHPNTTIPTAAMIVDRYIFDKIYEGIGIDQQELELHAHRYNIRLLPQYN